MSHDISDDLIQTLTDLSAWLLFGDDGTLVGDGLHPDAIARRTVAAAFVLRLGPLRDRRLDHFAADYGWSQRRLVAAAHDFATRFRMTHLPDDLTGAMHRSSVPRRHGAKPKRRRSASAA